MPRKKKAPEWTKLVQVLFCFCFRFFFFFFFFFFPFFKHSPRSLSKKNKICVCVCMCVCVLCLFFRTLFCPPPLLLQVGVKILGQKGNENGFFFFLIILFFFFWVNNFFFISLFIYFIYLFYLFFWFTQNPSLHSHQHCLLQIRGLQNIHLLRLQNPNRPLPQKPKFAIIVIK